MPKPKNPKKNNVAEESVTATDSATLRTDNISAGKTADTLPNREKTDYEAKSVEATDEAPKKVRKPEIVKSETRSNLVPINLEDEIRRLAYLLSERRGFEPGHEAEDWLSAEREVLDRYHQQSA
jgi:hypothetical protein